MWTKTRKEVDPELTGGTTNIVIFTSDTPTIRCRNLLKAVGIGDRYGRCYD